MVNTACKKRIGAAAKIGFFRLKDESINLSSFSRFEMTLGLLLTPSPPINATGKLLNLTEQFQVSAL